MTTTIPDVVGALPLGGLLRRTDPAGPTDAKIGFLGVYPAVTKTAHWKHIGKTYSLPIEVERTSFEVGSRSGAEIERNYLKLLKLSREKVLFFDMMPFYFASTSIDPESKRSMWSNVELYVKATGETLAVAPRPVEDKLLALCQSMPGNLERLKSILSSHTQLEMLFTLGNEAAAFVRKMDSARAAQDFLYKSVERRSVLGQTINVVHLCHPGILMKSEKWRTTHAAWCNTVGVQLCTTA